jgi:hypothetical protein
MQRNLKTLVLTLCAALWVASTALAAGKAKAVAAEPVKDLGTVPQGEQIVHEFVIRNDGDAVLEIAGVQPGPGCTVGEFARTIAPGQTGKVQAVLDTSTSRGTIATRVNVFTNDPDAPRVELTFRAKVEPHVLVKPGHARYLTVQREPVEGNIVQTLWSTDGAPFEITGADSPWPFLTVTYREAKPEERVADRAGRQWRLELKLSNEATVGSLADYVTVHLNHPKQKILKIPVSGFVRPVIAVTPPVADFGQITLKEPLRSALNIRSFATEPIKVTGVEQNLKGIEARLAPLTEGREYEVRLVLSPELGKGPFNGKIVIRTDSPKVPFLEVELKGTVL